MKNYSVTIFWTTSKGRKTKTQKSINHFAESKELAFKLCMAVINEYKRCAVITGGEVVEYEIDNGRISKVAELKVNFRNV